MLFAVKFFLLTILATQSKAQQDEAERMRIFALFSGTSNDLGLDHRLGRQVLKIAANKAQQLNPELPNIELVVHNDDTDCNNLNEIPNRLVEQFYLDERRMSECARRDAAVSIKQSCEASQDAENNELDQYLSQTVVSANSSANEDRQALGYQQKPRIHAIIGPSCDPLVDLVARMAAYWSTPIYSVTSIDGAFGRKDIYPTLTRLSPSIDQMSMFVVRTMQLFRWQHMAIVVDRRQREEAILLDNLERTINRLHYAIPIERKIFEYDSFRERETPAAAGNRTASLCSGQAREALLGAKQVARVFLLLLNDNLLVRRLLLCAHELQMNNGEFTFLAMELGLKSSEIQVQAVQASDGQSASSAQSSARAVQTYDWYSAEDERNNAIARQMFESLLVFSVELPISEEHSFFVEQTLDLAQQQFPGYRFERSSVGPVAVALHDSLLLAAAAFARQQRQLGAANRSSRAALMWNEQYPNGLAAGGMRINENGDQELDYVLNDLEPEMGVMRPVASFLRGASGGGQVKFLPDTYIHWPSRSATSRFGQRTSNQDEPPADEPECGFTGEAEHCVDRQNLYAALSVVSSLSVLVLASAAYSLLKYRRIKYEMQLDDFWWKIDWLELQFIQATDSLVSSRPQSLARALRTGGSVVSGSVVSGGTVQLAIAQKPSGASARSEAAKHRKAGPVVVPKIVTPGGDGEQSLVGDEADGKSMAQASGHSRGGGGPMSQVMGGSNTLANGAPSCNMFRSEYSSVVKSAALAMYKNELVIVKQLNSNSIEVSRELLVDLRSIREHINDNLCKFVGLCVETSRLAIVYEYCSRGSLRDLLANESIAMDWTLKYSIIGDILSGLSFIHTTQLDYHGRLKSSNLVLDSRFTVKITDFGLQNLYQQLDALEGGDDDEEDEDDYEDYVNLGGDQARDTLSLSVSQRGAPTRRTGAKSIAGASGISSRGGASSAQAVPAAGGTSKLQLKNRSAARYFWTAPEHLRDKNPHFAGSKKGDVFSLGVILFELITRHEPYYYGTNAKPYWPNIRAEKRRLNHPPSEVGNVHRPSQLDRLSAGLGARGSVVSSALSGSGSNASRRRSSAVRHHRVHPAGPGLPADTIAETASQASGLSGGPHSNAGDSTHESEHQSAAGSSKIQLIDAEEILDQLRMGVHPEPVRPHLPNHVLRQQDANGKLIELMRLCWAESANQRPTLNQVRTSMRKITKGMASKNYLDNLLERLQTYAADLERIVDERSGDIVAEKFRTEELLYQLVPKFVADRLKSNQPIVPQLFDGVTIFFSDIVGFDNYASMMSPSDLVGLLNTIYSSFDSIISSFDVTKIETIIDQFLIASGISLQEPPLEASQPAQQQQQQQQSNEEHQQVQDNKKRALLAALKIGSKDSPSSQETQATPEQQKENNNSNATGGLDRALYRRSSAEQIARMALCIRDLVKSAHFRQSLCKPTASGEPNPVASHFNIRIGIHSGKVCAGIVGVKRPKFCLIGDTVNVASRMQTNSKANKIQISADTKVLLETVPGFNIEPRGKIEVKGKGMMETFWLESAY